MQASHYIATKLGPVKVGDNVRVMTSFVSSVHGKLGVITEIDELTGVLTFKYVDDNENIRLVDILPSDIVGIIKPVDPTEELEEDDDDEVEEDLQSQVQQCLRDWKYPQVGECKFASLYDGCDEEVCSTNTAQKTKRLFISSMV